MASVSSFLVRKSGTNYEAAFNGSHITLKPNGQSFAKIVFDNSDNWVNGVFSEEDEVEVYVDSVSAANKLMTGYVTDVGGERNPNRNKTEVLTLIDWGSYLAAKTIFEKDYLRTKQADDVFTDAAAEISGISTNITNLNSSPTQDVKRTYNGTYVKDAWTDAAEKGGGDYFVDETKTLQAFDRGTRDLDETTTGLIYKIKDISPVTADTLMIDHRFPYSFHKNVDLRYRNVTVTNGIAETFPTDIDLFSTAKMQKGDISDERGKTFSVFWRQFGGVAEYDIDTTTQEPFTISSAEDIGEGLTMPTVKINVASATTDAETFGQGIDEDGNFIDMDLVPTDYQRISFYIKNGLLGASVNSIIFRLYNGPVGANYWERDIYNDVIVNGGSRTSWTYLSYDLPANITDSTTNGWTKNGSPTDSVSRIFFSFRNGASVLDGYTAGSGVSFAKLHFFRRRRSTTTGSGSPATEKIIVDAALKSQASLDAFSAQEHARANTVTSMGKFTIAGNPAFKRPAYQMEVDFTNTLGTGRSGTVRIEELRHILVDSHYLTQVKFNNSFHRV